MSHPFVYFCLALTIAAAIVFAQYLYQQKRTTRVWWLASLRWITFTAVIWLLFNPKMSRTVYTKVKPKLVVLLDNSKSISFLKQEETMHQIRNQLINNQDLNNKYDVTPLFFGEAINAQQDSLFIDNQTKISKALTQANKLHQTQAPIVLVTDGNQTEGVDYKFMPNMDVYPVLVGDTTSVEDVMISKVHANRYSFLNNEFPVEIFTRYEGSLKVNVPITIRQNNQIVWQKNVSFNKEKKSERLSLFLASKAVGSHQYTISLGALANEENISNNKTSFTVNVIDEQSKIALVYHALHPDLGALKQSIEANIQRKVELMTSTKTNINLDDYELVILYQPDQTFVKIFESLNSHPKNLMLVTGTRTDWNFLNAHQNFFNKKIIDQEEQYAPQLNTNFTAFDPENWQLDYLPPLNAWFGEVSFNVNHEVLLEQTIEGVSTKSPLLATFEFNKSKGVAIFGEGLWRWRMNAYLRHENHRVFDEMINQLMQYASIKHQPNQIDVKVNSFYYADEPIIIEAQLYDSNFNIDKNANLVVKIKGETTTKPFFFNGIEYQVELDQLKGGTYQFEIFNQNKLTYEGSFSVGRFAIEQTVHRANLADMTQLALQQYKPLYFNDDINKLIDDLLNNQDYKTVETAQTSTNSNINWRWILALIVVSLSAEWFVRKYSGLT